MEEEWDLVNSISSSLNIPEYIEKSTSVELNFNRFAEQPEFQLEDDGYPEDYDQQLMDEGVIFSDNSLPPEEEFKDESLVLDNNSDNEINFTLGDSNLLNNDTEYGDVQSDNNELELQRINQYENIITHPFFPINNFMDKQDNITRESEVDKQSLWQNTESGPSVPYISSSRNINKEQNKSKEKKPQIDFAWPPSTEGHSPWLLQSSTSDSNQRQTEVEESGDNNQEHQTQANPSSAASSLIQRQTEVEESNDHTRSTQAGILPSWDQAPADPSAPHPFSMGSFSFGFQTSQLLRKTEEQIHQKFNQLQLNLNKDNIDSNSYSSTEDDRERSPRPMKQVRRRTQKKNLQFTTQYLPSFAAAPKETKPVLSTEHLPAQSLSSSFAALKKGSPVLSTEQLPSQSLPDFSAAPKDTRPTIPKELFPSTSLPGFSANPEDTISTLPSELFPSRSLPSRSTAPGEKPSILSTEHLPSQSSPGSTQHFSAQSLPNSSAPPGEKRLSLSTEELPAHSSPDSSTTPWEKRSPLSIHHLPAQYLPSCFTGPKGAAPTLSTERLPAQSIQQLPVRSNQAPPTLSRQDLLNTINIPPVDEIKQNELENDEIDEDPELIVKRLLGCFQTSPEYEDQLAGIYWLIENKYPNPEIWHQIRHLNLSRQNLTGLNNLDTCLPVLESLDVSHNELKSIFGLPPSLCVLRASHNRLHEIDMYHLTLLQHLHVSHNFLNSFNDMSRLKSLRSLDASYNSIDSFQPLQSLTGLIDVSLRANVIRKLTGFYHGFEESQIETLDISFNRIECLEAVESLPKLRELDAEHNYIKCIQIEQTMFKLCKLKLSFNRLKFIDISLFPDIRTLYLDDNQIERIVGAACISRMDSLSLRDQGKQKVEYNIQYLRGARKLYLSGSPFASINHMKDFYSLETLELCSVGLEELPSDFGRMVPNLVNLYLSMNRLQNIRSLKRLKYLQRLILIDNKLRSLNEIISVVKHMKKLTILDLRQNPMSCNIYPTLDLSLNQVHSNNDTISCYIIAAHDISWEETDLEFQQSLSEHYKMRREVYRAYFITQCPNLEELDHIKVTLSEQSESEQVIEHYQQIRVTQQQQQK